MKETHNPSSPTSLCFHSNKKFNKLDSNWKINFRVLGYYTTRLWYTKLDNSPLQVQYQLTKLITIIRIWNQEPFIGFWFHSRHIHRRPSFDFRVFALQTINFDILRVVKLRMFKLTHIVRTASWQYVWTIQLFEQSYSRKKWLKIGLMTRLHDSSKYSTTLNHLIFKLI